MDIWFWQLIISPHMANLAKSLTELGHSVTYVAQREMSENRATQGWDVPDVGTAKVVLAADHSVAVALAKEAAPDAFHICQGIRANGIVGPVQQVLKALGRKQFVMMETVDDNSWLGPLKRIVYRYLFSKLSPYLMGVLANGANTRDWLIKRGVAAEKVFPFAYFLPETSSISLDNHHKKSARYRVLFVGQFIKRKRLDLLITAIARLDSKNVELAIIGSGPLEKQLRELAESMLNDRVDWVGSLPMDQVRRQMALADCLVLPSRHDGWGAVISEALMSGTPVICSDTCGSAVVAAASGYGGIFKSGNVDDLASLLSVNINEGRLSQERSYALSVWSRCLSGTAGARYLIGLIEAIHADATPPPPPWYFSNGMH